MADVLKDTEILERARHLSDPTVEIQQLLLRLKSKYSIAAGAFVNNLVKPSEATAHHPDIEIFIINLKLT